MTYREALEAIVWKLTRNESPTGEKADSRPARIDRNDVVIRQAIELLERGN